jgi:hypothetical protein
MDLKQVFDQLTENEHQNKNNQPGN